MAHVESVGVGTAPGEAEVQFKALMMASPILTLAKLSSPAPGVHATPRL